MSMHHSRLPARLTAAPLLTVAAVLALAGPASAHVSVSSPDAAREGYGKVVFRVPTESDTADTTKLVVTLPADTPFLHLTAQPKPGWKVFMQEGPLPEPVEVDGTEITEAVRTVTWTAEGDGIAPGEFDEFALSGGPFPDADSVRFAAEQTYDDGEVVDWDQVQQGDEEPEKPAPTLTLLAASADGHGSGGHGAGADADEASSASDDQGGSDTLSRVLSAAALAVAALALLGVVRQDRRRA
ncbi:YcnI family protein [Aeromicrobium sp. Leaf272]|uniref:YcnI family copper-binding membrane protein n=1 Tax=Aeromicrobium sp. Leaf272 TaxID=1736317 RepID=UPI0006F49FB1|nr:YcnI family protein [Aeromicrobium sp. Leaf272]KQP28717.1 hypothetical protein ASF38_16710 [Aeromicrobium sp. Leaf272]